MFPFLTNPIIRKVFAISNLHNHNHWLLDTLSFLLQRMFPFHRSKYFLSFQIKSFKSKGFWLLKNKKKRKTFPFHHSKIVIAISPNVSPPQKSNHSKICTPASRRNWGAILLPSFSRLRANCSPFFFSKRAIFLTLNVSFPQESTIQRTLGFAQPSWGGAELSFSFPLLIRTRNGAKCFLFWKDSWHSLLDWDKTFPLYSNPIIKNVSVFYNFNKNVFYGFPGWRRGCYAIISYFCGVEQESSSF